MLALMDVAFSFLAASGGLVEKLEGTAHGLGERFGFEAPFFIAQVVNFLIVAFVLYRFAYKPVIATLDERQRKINDGLQYAEQMKLKLAETEKHYHERVKEGHHEAQRILEDAREQSKRLLDKQTREAAERAQELIAQAQLAAEREHEKMLAQLRQEVRELVVEATSKVLRKELSQEERTRYAEAAARELHANN